jgi:hypothetical protein
VASRTGTRVLAPSRALGWFAPDFGEDWVVPKSAVRYLVARRTGAALLLTAYGKGGEVLGERLFADAIAGEDVMRGLSDAGLVESWREIPEGSASATRFLDAVATSKGGSA